jgi:flagellar basal body-associated protein FliL
MPSDPNQGQIASLIISIIILIIVIILIIIVCCNMYNTNNNTQQPRIQNPQAAALAAVYKYKNNFVNNKICKTVNGANSPNYARCITTEGLFDGICYSGICDPVGGD